MRGKPITCRLFIPDGNGYRDWHELTDEEKEAFGRRCANRMGQALNDCFSRNIQEYQKI